MVAGIFLLKPTITGFVTTEETSTYTQSVALSVDRDAARSWFPEHIGRLKSVALSGSISKQGSAKVYIEHNNSAYLIFDSGRLNLSNSYLITGFAVLEQTEADQDVNGSTDEPDETDLVNETATDETINETLLPDETAEDIAGKSVSININGVILGKSSRINSDNRFAQPRIDRFTMYSLRHRLWLFFFLRSSSFLFWFISTSGMNFGQNSRPCFFGGCGI